MYTVYILACDSRRTYVGATVDLARRLRQHNGDLVGGARRTHGVRWRVACTIVGFRTWPEALKYEYALRRVGRREVKRWDLEGRRRAVEALRKKERWSSTSPLASEVPLRVTWTDDSLLRTAPLPDAVDD
jgi:predicted GIY-YIG superfamily endonuclease